MKDASNTSVTGLLLAWRQGDKGALNRLTPLVYNELHRMAAAYMRRERPDHTMSPTSLISEAFLRLSEGDPIEFEDRVRFFALAAHQMRNILVDHARRRTAGKRGHGNRPVTFDEALLPDERPEHLVALDEALDALAAFDERKARIVELHYFGGLGQKEIATALELSEITISRELRTARAWLHRYLLNEA